MSGIPDLVKMPIEERLHYLAQVEAHLCRKSFYYFARLAWPIAYPSFPFVDGWHIAAMCYHLQAVYEKKAFSKDGDQADTLVISIPSGCGKSSICSVLFSAWLWAIQPNAGQWYASFGYNTLDRDALETRRLVESDWFRSRFWNDISLTDDQNQKRRFNNSSGGWRLAASIGSKTGFGEHPAALVIDDPHDPEQALTDQRMVAIDAWDNKYASRGIVHGVAKACVGQMLGQGDLQNHILQTEDEVVHCCIPMWFDPERKCTTNITYLDIDSFDENGSFVQRTNWEDPRTEAGELMWPEKMDQKKVDRVKRRLRTAHKISAQLQQNPTAPEGDTFQEEWLDYVDAPPTHGVAARAWDKASSTNRKSDYTAGALWVYDGDYFYLCDMVRGKWERKERDKIIMETAKSDAEVFPDYTILFEQEGGSSGKDIVGMSLEKFYDAGFKVRTMRPLGKSSDIRWESLADGLSQGRVKIVKGGWNKKFVLELLAAPDGVHDDQIDAADMGIRKLRNANRFQKVNRPLLLLTPEEQTDLGYDIGLNYEPEDTHRVLGVKW